LSFATLWHIPEGFMDQSEKIMWVPYFTPVQMVVEISLVGSSHIEQGMAHNHNFFPDCRIAGGFLSVFF
jgi:hypothetical protein